MNTKKPCAVCGNAEYDEYWGPNCKATSYCHNEVIKLEEDLRATTTQKEELHSLLAKLQMHGEDLRREIERLNRLISEWRKVLADLALHNCCDEVCFGPCSTKRAGDALKLEASEKRKDEA